MNRLAMPLMTISDGLMASGALLKDFTITFTNAICADLSDAKAIEDTPRSVCVALIWMTYEDTTWPLRWELGVEDGWLDASKVGFFVMYMVGNVLGEYVEGTNEGSECGIQLGCEDGWKVGDIVAKVGLEEMGCTDGFPEGCSVGWREGNKDGLDEGLLMGICEGWVDGILVGFCEGWADGSSDGCDVGWEEGSFDGWDEGSFVGDVLGCLVGYDDGIEDGSLFGCIVGDS